MSNFNLISDGKLKIVSSVKGTIEFLEKEIIDTGLDLIAIQKNHKGLQDLYECSKIVSKQKDRSVVFSRVLEDIQKEIDSNEMFIESDVAQIYKQQIENENNILNTKDYSTHDFVKTFVSTMQSANKDSMDFLNDSEIECTRVNTTLKCPLSQTAIKVPVRDSRCNHTFEKESIEILIQHCSKRRKQTKCPFSNCTNIIELKNLIEVKPEI